MPSPSGVDLTSPIPVMGTILASWPNSTKIKNCTEFGTEFAPKRTEICTEMHRSLYRNFLAENFTEFEPNFAPKCTDLRAPKIRRNLATHRTCTEIAPK